MPPPQIPHLDQLASLYAFANLERNPVHPDFDLLRFSEFPGEVKKMLPPHRRDFYTLIFFEDQKEGQVQVNQDEHRRLTNAILFQGKSHVFSFIRDAGVKGSVLLFKPSFLAPEGPEVDFRYPFFSLLQQNLFHLSTREQAEFNRLLDALEGEMQARETAKYLLLALLEKCRGLSETYAQEVQYISKQYRLTRKFKELVNNYFYTEKQVEFYAAQLNLSPNHLNEVVKSQSQKTAKRHIQERVALEAQNLLRYTDLDIAEIAHALNFSETSHFNRFFKKETRSTPRNFRLQHR